MAGFDDPTRAKYIVGHTSTRGQKYVKLENGVIVVNDATNLRYVRIKANGEFNPDTDIHYASGKKAVEVVKPADITPKDKVKRQGAAKTRSVVQGAAKEVAKGVAKIDWGNF